jgi:hypothetical protein
MNRHNLLARVFVLLVTLIVTLLSLSCGSTTGVGAGVGYPTRWGGGGNGRPPVFVGGPS